MNIRKPLTAFLLLILCLLLWGCAPQESAQTTPAVDTVTPTPEPTPVPTPETFTLTFAGDCTLGGSESSFYSLCGFVKTIGEDYRYPFENVIEYFEQDDFSMVNLEGVLWDKSAPMVKEFVFRGPTAYVNILTQNSVEAVTVSNNHSRDHGQKGYDSTVATLTEADVAFVEQDSTMIYTTDSGLTIGCYAVNLGRLDKDTICAAISALANDPTIDIVVMAAHWGVENTYRPTEIQMTIGQAAIDAGADIVYGTHPHVLQPIQEYNGGYLFYSLGNFSFGGNGDPKDYDTAILQVEVIRDTDGTVRLGGYTAIPCSVSTKERMNDFRPTPYAADSKEYARVMSKLDGSFSGRDLPWG